MQPKDPQEAIEYTMDWTAYLETNETIVTSTWAIVNNDSPATLAKDSDTKTDKTTTVWLSKTSGGTPGKEYMLANTIVTNTTPARTYERTIIVPVIQE
jgi:hypothetical protein